MSTFGPAQATRLLPSPHLPDILRTNRFSRVRHLHLRLTPNGTRVIANMQLNKVVEYDFDGNELWSFQQALELTPSKEVVWALASWTRKSRPTHNPSVSR
jgi:hypothetical protein